MLPSKLNYPEFVPDQLLTSDHLNQLFEYLEEQGRLSRTNLIGIGIVCGLEVKTSADGSSITITKGCGVTSEGYLVTVPETTYTTYKAFNAVQDRLYNRFVDVERNSRFPIDELKQAAVEEGTTALNATFISDKIVLLFVEILEEGSKNCNPNSCDDKGVNVTLSFRPLIISKEHGNTLLSNQTGGETTKSYQRLPGLKMRRFDVPATPLPDTSAIFEAYRKVLNSEFLAKAESLLGDAYEAFAPLILDIYPANPFDGLAGKFQFLSNDDINAEQLLHLQYYYDLFSDILLAYDELRAIGTQVIGLCCPDSELFPRHLLLGEAAQTDSNATSSYRQSFIPSPILNNNNKLAGQLRILFTRLALLAEKFSIQPSEVGDFRRLRKADTSIRITPSKYGDVPLSQKAIPFYYKVAEGPLKLYQFWSPEKRSLEQDGKNLSYHSKQYNDVDDEVINPMHYDLEPHNFLRIEGHIGKPYQRVLQDIIALKNRFRLPFEVIALGGNLKSLRQQILELAEKTREGSLSDFDDADSKCEFKDLESLYDTLAAELTCMLCKEMKYFYNLPGEIRQQLPAPASTIPQASLLQKCDPNFRFTANTFGHQFEIFYSKVKNTPYINADVFLGSGFNMAATAQNNNLGLALLYYIQKLSESINSNLRDFSLAGFNTPHQDLLRIAEQIKSMFGQANTDNTSFTEDVIDHLDVLLYACKPAQFTSLYRDYLSRWMYVLMLQKFAFFIRMHPGIQHKAGVTIGGTFILVYHEEVVQQQTPAVRGSATRSTVSASSSRIKTNLSSASRESEVNTRSREIDLGDSIVNSSIFTVQQREALQDLFREQKTNPVLDELVAEIEDGTVVADFFLPYLCYSNCPPIHFSVDEKEPPAEKLSISLKDRELCSDSEIQIVEVSPEGGELAGEGIVSNADGTSSFDPAKVDLGSADQKTVTITYSKDGGSVSLDVLVQQQPVAAFEAKAGRIASQISFKNTSKFAKTYFWDFGDGQKSEEENPPAHRYTTEGPFTISLTASNGICTHTVSQIIEIKNPVSKTCLPAAEVIAGFRSLGKDNPRMFKVFRDSYQPYTEIEGFFKEFEVIVNEEVQKQIDFLANKRIHALLEKWLNELLRFVENSDLQVQALALYNVLVNLAMYIACIQQEDADKAKVPMAGVFALVFKHLNAVKSSLPNFPDGAKQLLNQLLENLAAEEQRIKSNKEDTSKSGYFGQIQELIKFLKEMGI